MVIFLVVCLTLFHVERVVAAKMFGASVTIDTVGEFADEISLVEILVEHRESSYLWPSAQW